MANWFEDHPTRSIIVHTLVVAAVVWAAFAFLFDENKVAVHKAQAENYKAKTEVLEVELSRLREENRKYLEWLTATPNTIPHLEARLKTAAEEAAQLKAQLAASTSSGMQASGGLASSPYSVSQTINLGETFMDRKTLASVGLANVTNDRTATLMLTLPGSQTRELSDVKPGTAWSYSHEKTNYQLILSRVDWYGNKATISVVEVPGPK
ncbi:hypothetical protein [Methylomonas rhizoryzae]|uniref:hypothetical protein n=1 Tax=Methylomonas rhizoryzae TaxID=2608981 RepID=UPI0012321BC7|nr:hypothetical protein [Methylomonas rhizoryzae]